MTLSEDELCERTGEAVVDLSPVGTSANSVELAKSHLRAVYSACHACVMPSLLESLSSSHLEAMQWGKPQISANLPYAS